jgi:hypothetical protein
MQELMTRFFDDPAETLPGAAVAVLLDPFQPVRSPVWFPKEDHVRPALLSAWQELHQRVLDNSEAMQQPLVTDLDEEPAPSKAEQHQGSTTLRQDEDSESDDEDGPGGRSTAVEAEVALEMAQYKNLRKSALPVTDAADDKTRLLRWWRETGSQQFPNLARVARSALAVMATEANCERLFSMAERVLSRGRHNLKEERVDLALFVNGNWADHNDRDLYRSVHNYVMERILSPSTSTSSMSAGPELLSMDSDSDSDSEEDGDADSGGLID